MSDLICSIAPFVSMHKHYFANDCYPSLVWLCLWLHQVSSQPKEETRVLLLVFSWVHKKNNMLCFTPQHVHGLAIHRSKTQRHTWADTCSRIPILTGIVITALALFSLANFFLFLLSVVIWTYSQLQANEGLVRRELRLKLGTEENQASLRVWIWCKPFFFWDRRDANTWRRRAIRVMRQLQPWNVEPKIRMTGRGLRMSSLRSPFAHLTLSSRMLGSPSPSPLVLHSDCGRRNCCWPAGCWEGKHKSCRVVPFLGEVIHFSLASTKSTFSSCFELLQSVRMLINGGDSLNKFQRTERTTDIHLRLWRNNK